MAKLLEKVRKASRWALYLGAPPGDCVGCNADCQIVGFPPFSNIERADQEAGTGKMPARLFDALTVEEQSVTSAMGLSRCVAHVPCLWYDPVEQRCRYHKWRPAYCRKMKVGGSVCSQCRKR